MHHTIKLKLLQFGWQTTSNLPGPRLRLSPTNRLPAATGRGGYSFAPCLRSSMTIDLSLDTEHPPAVQACRPCSPTQPTSRQSRGGLVIPWPRTCRRCHSTQNILRQPRASAPALGRSSGESCCCQPDSGKPTVRDERGAHGTVDYGGIRNPLALSKERIREPLRLRLRTLCFYRTGWGITRNLRPAILGLQHTHGPTMARLTPESSGIKWRFTWR